MTREYRGFIIYPNVAYYCHIWQERNNKLFKQLEPNVQHTVRKIVEDVKNRLDFLNRYGKIQYKWHEICIGN